MLLPDLNFLLKICGIDAFDVIRSMAAKGDFPGGPSIRTLAKIKNGTSESRPSTINKMREGLTKFATRFGGPATSEIAEFVRTLSIEDGDTYESSWETFYEGAEISADEPALLTCEIRRLIGLSMELRDNFKHGKHSLMISKLGEVDIPKTAVTDTAFKRLRTMNDGSVDAIGAALTPLMLSNVLYLMVCAERESGRIERLRPLYKNGKTISPLVRWMDALRDMHGLTNDEELGQLFYPNQTEARREIKKWRAGEVPSWKVIRRVAYGIPEQQKAGLYTSYAIVCLYTVLEILGQKVEKQISEFDRKMLFDSIPELDQYAAQKTADLRKSDTKN